MSRRDYEKAIRDELAQAGGVLLSMERGGKHYRAIFQIGAVRAMHVYPSTPSDAARGMLNNISMLKRAIERARKRNGSALR